MIEFIIIALASWYTAYTITKLSGPLNIFGVVRAWSRRKVVEGASVSKGSFAEAIECIYCVAFWAGASLYALWFTPLQPIVYVLAIAGGALAVDRWISS
jgi:hypothetical protein